VYTHFVKSFVAHNARVTKVGWDSLCYIGSWSIYTHFVSQLLHIMLGLPKSSFVLVKYIHVGTEREKER
jgi:hypothetical protein